MRISDWSADVCSSDLPFGGFRGPLARGRPPLVGGDRGLALRRSLDIEFVADPVGAAMPYTRHAGGAPHGNAVDHHALQRVDLRRMDVAKAGELRRAAALDVAAGKAFALSGQSLYQGSADPDAHGLADARQLTGAGRPIALLQHILHDASLAMTRVGQGKSVYRRVIFGGGR